MITGRITRQSEEQKRISASWVLSTPLFLKINLRRLDLWQTLSDFVACGIIPYVEILLH